MNQPLGISILDVVTSKALDDAEYRQALLANPNDVLASEGLTIPDGVTVKIVENTEDTIHLVLPTEIVKTLDLTEVDITAINGHGGVV